MPEPSAVEVAMSLHVDTSVQIVWALANTEANLAGDDRIRPVHFFLGVLKLIDPQFQRQLEGVELPEEGRQQVAQHSRGLRQYLEMTCEEVTRLRRSVRRQLREGKSARKDIRMLHRSDDSRDVFQAAAAKVVGAGGTALSVAHLAEALFETGSVSLDKLKNLKCRPSSKGARWEMVDDEKSPGRQQFADWFGRNLSKLAAEGSLAPFVGREAEITVILRVLARTSKRHVVVTGGPGVGKTALVEGTALSLVGKKVPDPLKGCEILELHGSDVAADCDSEAQLSRRLRRLFGMLDRMKTGVLFIDDFGALFPSHLKPDVAYALLTTLLAEDGTPLVVTVSSEQWTRLKEAAPSLSRRFHAIELGDPSESECRGIAEAWAQRIGASHGITFTADAIQAVLQAADAVPHDRALPDRIVDLLENAATYVRVSALSSRTGQREVQPESIQAVLAEHYGLRADTRRPNAPRTQR